MQTPKKFSSFSDQVSWISDEKGIKIKDREYAEEMLRQIGYFPLMGGYKHLFRISNTKKYKAGTSFEEIVSLYKFDAELRELFFKYLLQIERQMRSLMSYYFTEMYGAEQKQYLDANNYNNTKRNPLCGSGMYGNVNRKKKKDGTLYKDYFYYACKHRRLVDGHKCGYRKQWSEEKINNAVEAVIRKLVKNPKFEEAILNKIGSRIDTEEIEKEIEGLEKQHRQLTGAKARLGQQMDSLDIMDKFYEKKYQDMEARLYRLYDEIEGVENSIEEVKNRLLNIQQQKISEENVYQFLLYFDKLYDKFTDLEKKEFLNSFVEQVDIYEQEQPDGRFLKHIKFRFPVYFGDREQFCIKIIDYDTVSDMQ